MLRQAGWTYAKTLHQFAQRGVHTVQGRQNTKRTLSGRILRLEGCAENGTIGHLLNAFLFSGSSLHSLLRLISLLLLWLSKFIAQDLKYVLLVIQDSKVSPQCQCPCRHHSLHFLFHFLPQPTLMPATNLLSLSNKIIGGTTSGVRFLSTYPSLSLPSA